MSAGIGTWAKTKGGPWTRHTVFIYSFGVPELVLNRRLNYRNVVLTERPGGEIGYALRNGERRFVPWLGFIERAAARALEDARPVRLTDITRVGVAGWPAPEWRDVPPGECVHGCLTSRGAFAIYDAVVALVADGQHGNVASPKPSPLAVRCLWPQPKAFQHGVRASRCRAKSDILLVRLAQRQPNLVR